MPIRVCACECVWDGMTLGGLDQLDKNSRMELWVVYKAQPQHGGEQANVWYSLSGADGHNVYHGRLRGVVFMATKAERGEDLTGILTTILYDPSSVVIAVYSAKVVHVLPKEPHVSHRYCVA